MGMHEFEDLVEETVRLLDASNRANELELRTMFCRLYEFQAYWDTGFTHFRVMDILLKRRFVYRFDLNQHPDYARYRQYFDNLHEFTHLRLNPDQPWNESENPAIGYYKPPYLYCDAGSMLWQRLVEAGLLTGEDTIPPNKQVTLPEVVKVAVEEAYNKADFSLISWWYSLLIVHLFSFTKDKELDLLKNSSAMRKVIALCYQVNRHKTEKDVANSYQDRTGWRWPLPKSIEVLPDLLRVLREENRVDDREETVVFYQEQRRRYELTPGEEYANAKDLEL